MESPAATAASPGDLANLPRLLDRYADPNQRSYNLLAEIGTLIAQADQAGLLRPGISPTEVVAILGPPYRMLGEAGDACFDWHYPTRPPLDAERTQDPWYLVLRFRDGVVERVEHRIFREAD